MCALSFIFLPRKATVNLNISISQAEFRGMNSIKDDNGDALSDIPFPVDLPDFEEQSQAKESLFEPFLQAQNSFDNLHRTAMDGIVLFNYMYLNTLSLTRIFFYLRCKNARNSFPPSA